VPLQLSQYFSENRLPTFFWSGVCKRIRYLYYEELINQWIL
jgi:hypothetical protein